MEKGSEVVRRSALTLIERVEEGYIGCYVCVVEVVVRDILGSTGRRRSGEGWGIGVEVMSPPWNVEPSRLNFEGNSLGLNA